MIAAHTELILMCTHTSEAARPHVTKPLVVERQAPTRWTKSITATECTLHQLAPYIGKLKSSIARELLDEFSQKKDLIVDPFCGSGTIPLEAALSSRRIFACDASVYAYTLTKGKLMPTEKLSDAIGRLSRYDESVNCIPNPDLRNLPKWVRAFFHPKTLRETIKWAEVLRKEREFFLLSCLLGILHHQRPGFLSYPSSHLVPYLRSIKYPKEEYPEMYEFRDVLPRLSAKVERAFRRLNTKSLDRTTKVQRTYIESSKWPLTVDAVITSPPYMNALDYVRDNRLRLWFLGQNPRLPTDSTLSSKGGFRSASAALAKKVELHLRGGRYCVIVIGEKCTRLGDRYPSDQLCEIFERYAPSLFLKQVIRDQIPDVRRARRGQRGVKNENTLIFQKQS